MTSARTLVKFLALPAGEQALLLQSVAGLTFTAATLRLFGYKRVQRWLRRKQSVRSSAGLDEARRRALAVQRVARRLPYATCLPRSLTLWWLLQRQGIEADIHVGVKKEDGELKAHAWVECQGTILGDTSDVRRRFIPFRNPVRRK